MQLQLELRPATVAGAEDTGVKANTEAKAKAKAAARAPPPRACGPAITDAQYARVTGGWLCDSHADSKYAS